VCVCVCGVCGGGGGIFMLIRYPTRPDCVIATKGVVTWFVAQFVVTWLPKQAHWSLHKAINHLSF
jgi:hypothetical protein